MSGQYKEYAKVFKAVSDETRLNIIEMLSSGEMCACQILEEFSISQSTLSYHMKILSESGLVNCRRDGAWMRYTLNKNKTEDAMVFFTGITNEKEDSRCKKYIDQNADNCCCDCSEAAETDGRG